MLTVRERAWLRLHLTRGIGRTGLFQLQASFKSPETILENHLDNWPPRVGRHRVESIHPVRENDPLFLDAVATLEKNNARLVSFWDDEYPELLKEIHDPPALLYIRGQLEKKISLAVVGSRRSSVYGKSFTRDLCLEIAGQGVDIVSGLARGIDSAAHEGALDAGGSTTAVLGCGIDHVYPPENSRLFHRICEQGAIISEYPPGTRPLPGHFPGRNRIISGLSQGVLIVEAAEGSGSLITADFALEQGREVFAIPGAIASTNSKGVNNLLKDGAHLVTDPQDVLNVIMSGSGKSARTAPPEFIKMLSEPEQTLIRQLSDEPTHIDDLARKSGLTPMELSAILLQLELREVVLQLPGMRYIAAFRWV